MFLRSVLYPPPPKTSVIACFIGNFKVNFRKEENRTVTYFFADYAKSERKKPLGLRYTEIKKKSM